MTFTPQYSERYSRQMRFAPIGEAGQAKLARSSVLVVGCGALGTHVAESMVRAGVRRVGLIDRDRVEASNLPRQVLFDEQDAAESTPKAEAAARHLQRINSDVAIESVFGAFTAENAAELIAGRDLVLDGTDNLETRYAINAAAVKAKVPWIYGGVVAGSGAVMAVPPVGPCFRCLYAEAPEPGEVPTCAEIGVIGPAVAVTAAIEARAALRYLVEGVLDAGELNQFDLWSGVFHRFEVRKDPDCPVCGRNGDRG